MDRLEKYDRLDKFYKLFDAHFERDAFGYTRFAQILSDIAGRNKNPWQKTFIYNILRQVDGYDIGDQMWKALLVFEKERSGASRQHAVVSQFIVQRHAIVLSPSQPCAWEECPENFVPNHPNGRYCSDRCGMDAKNKRRREVRAITLLRDK